MEDDEFGDLYTDVLTSFTNSSSLPVQNTVSVDNNRKDTPNLTQFNGGISGSELNRIKLDEPAGVLETDSEVNLPDKRNLGFEDPNLIDESLINVIEDDANGDVDVLDVGIGDSVIPGLSINGNGGDFREGDDDCGNDSDSDSDDGLQIVLNEYKNGQLRDGEDVDQDGNILVVRDEDAEKQEMDDEEWARGGQVLRVRDKVEMMDLGDGFVKVMEVVPPPKIGFGYNNQFHSQFKYMRPGAAPLASGGPSGQVSAPLIVGPTPGRGRGDWRPLGLKNAPPMQNGMPVWANNNPGHGFGRGLDFTLPSHKTVFEVDIDSFEEKPWRFHGVNLSDFFNFGLNEDSWKEYCKQLEQLRLEATMQSKIRVYESGRTEQNYDPDLPPEPAAAAGIHEISADNTNLEKAEVGHTDTATGSMGARPQLQTGRAIQVETCYSERLPSIDTRPPRIRDSDAIIEIVLQDSADDDSVNGNDITELLEDTSREGLRSSHDIEGDNAQEDTEILDSAPEAYSDRKRELSGRKVPLKKPVHGRMIGDGLSRVMLEAPVQNPSSSVEKNPVYAGPLRDERGRKGRIDRSPSITHSGGTKEKRHLCNQKGESAENIGLERSPHFSSCHTRGVTEEQCYEEEDSIHDEQPDGSFELDRVDVDLNVEDAHKDKYSAECLKKRKINLRNEQSLEDVDDREGSKAARSSENSKAISGSTSDYRNFPYGTEDEVVQDGRSTRMGIKNKVNEGDHRSRSKGREERKDMDRHHMVIKGRVDPYYPKNWDSDRIRHSHLKADFIDRRKESGNSGGSWLRKDEESRSRTRFEDPRKRDHGNEMGHIHRSKVREIVRNDLEQYQLRKQLGNGGWTGSYRDKYTGLQHWDRDDKLKSRSDNLDDLHSKRRKDFDLKRDRGENEDLLHVYRKNTSLHKRERDDIMEQRRRNDIARFRNVDQQSVRHREEIWFPRERVDRQWNGWKRLKQSHEETLSKREREDVRGLKIGRTGEEKSWASHFRTKDELKGSEREYHLKDPGHHSEQHKRKERVETERLSRQRGGKDVYSRETRPNSDERRSRSERLSAGSDRAPNASEHQRMPEKKHKEYPRKMKESEEDHKSVVHSRGIQDGQISERVKIKGMIQQGSGDQVIPVSHQSSRKRKKDSSSDDEQHELMRGHSKLGRWTSHKKGNFNCGITLSSLNVKEIDDHKAGTLVANTVSDESFKTVETGDYPHSLANERDAGDQVNKDGEVKVKPKEDVNLDSVAKLKKQSEGFKLPLSSEKELGAVKKIENEQLPPDQTESRTDLEIKQEHPARKRRWTGN